MTKIQNTENPAHDGLVALKFNEHENPNGGPGRSLTLSSFDMRPLGYDQLVAVPTSGTSLVPFEIFNAKVIETDAEEFDKNKCYSFSTILETHLTTYALSLVKGGWLPSALAASRVNTMMLLDRNVVSMIVNRFKAGRPVGISSDFIDLLEELPLRINPILYAFEGNARTTPSAELVSAQLSEVSEKITASLPQAKLIVGPDTVKGILGLLEDWCEVLNRQQRFLVQMAPILSSPIAQNRMDDVWYQILDAAAVNGLSPKHLIVIAVLCAATAKNGSSPASRLLKFKRGYNESDAYNAICDLRALDILIICLATYPSDKTMLCTADKNLALFWCGLQVKDITNQDGKVSYSVTPWPALMAEKYAEMWAKL